MSRPLVHQFTLQHALKVRSESYRKKVRSLIKTGGLSSEINEDEFIGLQILWGIMFPIFVLILNFALEMGLSPVMLVGLGAVGFYLPQIHSKGAKKKRELSVRADLPFISIYWPYQWKQGWIFSRPFKKLSTKQPVRTVFWPKSFQLF